MPWFVKTERFTTQTLSLLPAQRQAYLAAHRAWVKGLISSGIKVSSGYLVDAGQRPGGGGLLILKADSFEAARRLVEQDPMIVEGLVDWNLQEWIPVCGELIA
ncbi:MAG: YciI family protein [Prochlorococcus sp.]